MCYISITTHRSTVYNVVNLSAPAIVPFVERDLGGPVVKRAGHKDFFGGRRPPEHGRSGLCWTLVFTFQVLLPGQKLLDFLWSLDSTISVYYCRGNESTLSLCATTPRFLTERELKMQSICVFVWSICVFCCKLFDICYASPPQKRY